MRVSVVLSTYNGAKYITEQLDSLRNQHYTIDEVIISDDCSTDDTPEIITNYIAKYNLKNWEFSVNKRNLGWRKNFMNLIWKADGDIIFTCDQDDIWDASKIETMVDIMRGNCNISMLACGFTEFYEDGTEVLCPKGVKKELIRVHKSNNIFKIPFPGCSYAIRKELAQKTRIYWRESFPHDAILWRLSLFENTLYTYGESLFKMRKHRSSSYSVESRSLKSKQVKRDWIDYGIETIDILDEFLRNEKNIDDEARSILKKNREWLEERKRFYDQLSIISGLKLIEYLDCYPAKKQYLGDWYLIFLKK